MLLIANMSAMQQPASAGEGQQERQQCDERGINSSDATKNNETMHWVVVEAMGKCDGGNRCVAMANITISQTQ
jgi:hypothetical protein